MEHRQDKYSRTARILHWISAAVIMWAMISGFGMALLEPGSALRATIAATNVSLTTSLIPIFAFRAWYARVAPRPRALDVPGWQRRAARATHRLLYTVTTAVLLSGPLMMDHEISVFRIVLLPNPLTDPFWNDTFHLVHRYSCMLLALLVGVHVLAVIRHHLKGIKVLRRMI